MEMTLMNYLKGRPRFTASIRDDDPIDQLHHFVTVCLLASFALLIGVKEYSVGQLDCSSTNLTIKQTQKHVNTYCWTHKLYRYPNPDNLSQVPYALSPDHGGPVNSTILGHDDLGEINFYRWITVLFLCQAFMFKLPNLIWSQCNEYSGTQIEKIVAMFGNCSFEENKVRKCASVALFLEQWLKINGKLCINSQETKKPKNILQYWLQCMDISTGLSTMYIIVKAMYLVNVFLQFFILTSFLEFDYWGYGVRVMEIFHRNAEKIDNIHFPRVALCHFQLHGQGCWIQCLLTINMLLEKLFVVEWFWLFFLLILTVFNFIAWLVRVVRTGRSEKFVTKYLSVSNEGLLLQDKTTKFVQEYLGNDGVFILRIIATNTNDVVMLELVTSVWRRYLKRENPKPVSKKTTTQVDTTV